MKDNFGVVLVVICFLALIGCIKRIPINDCENFGLQANRSWVKFQGDNDWLKVIRVESDTVYVVVNFSNRLLAKPMNLVKQVKTKRPKKVTSFISGFLLGTSLSLISWFCLLNILI